MQGFFSCFIYLFPCGAISAKFGII